MRLASIALVLNRVLYHKSQFNSFNSFNSEISIEAWLIYTEYYLLHFYFFAYSLAFCCAWASSVENLSERGKMVCWFIWVWYAVCR